MRLGCFRPDLTLVPLDTCPTGLLVVPRPLAGSRVRLDRYDQIIQEVLARAVAIDLSDPCSQKPGSIRIGRESGRSSRSSHYSGASPSNVKIIGDAESRIQPPHVITAHIFDPFRESAIKHKLCTGDALQSSELIDVDRTGVAARSLHVDAIQEENRFMRHRLVHWQVRSIG